MKDATTFAGSSAAVLAVVNVVQHTTGWFERWFALSVAMAIALCTIFFLKSPAGMKFSAKLVSGIITGFMLYCSAFGIQNSIVAEASQPVKSTVISAPDDVTLEVLPLTAETPEAPSMIIGLEPIIEPEPPTPPIMTAPAPTPVEVLPVRIREIMVQPDIRQRTWSSKWN